MSSGDRNRNSDWRGRRGFVVALATVCASLIVIFSPYLGGAFDALSGGLASRPLYPIRVDLRPATARHDSTGTPLTVPASVGTGPDSAATPDEPDGQATRTELVDATGRRLTSTRGQTDFLPLDFDIAPEAGTRVPSGGSQIDTTKPVSLNGVEAGSINVRVSRDLRIYLDRAGLAQALLAIDSEAGARITEGKEQPFLSLDELRSRGISVRYDPVADRIRLET